MGRAVIQHPSASFAFTARCRIVNRPGMLGQLTSAIGSLGGDIRAVDIVRVEGKGIVRDITVLAADADHAQKLIQRMAAVPGVEVLEYSDRTFLAHLGGKIEVTPRLPIRTRDDLSMVYTPGVARICMAIAEDPRRVRNLTIKRNAVAIVTDGSAVLGLGNIGPDAAIPVMEGKSMLFKEFGSVDAFPICLATQDVDEIVADRRATSRRSSAASTSRTSPLRDALRSSAVSPSCSTSPCSTTTSTALQSSSPRRSSTRSKIVGKQLEDVRVVCLGVGAAGTAVSRLLIAAGVGNIIGVDRAGILDRG